MALMQDNGGRFTVLHMCPRVLLVTHVLMTSLGNLAMLAFLQQDNVIEEHLENFN
jgi:hypothetical protein